MTKNEALRTIRELGGRIETFGDKTFVRFDQRGCDYYQTPGGTVYSVNGGILYDPPTDDYVRWGVDEPDQREREYVASYPDVTKATDIAAYDWFHATPSPDPKGYPYHDGDRCQCVECHPPVAYAPEAGVPEPWEQYPAQEDVTTHTYETLGTGYVAACYCDHCGNARGNS